MCCCRSPGRSRMWTGGWLRCSIAAFSTSLCPWCPRSGSWTAPSTCRFWRRGSPSRASSWRRPSVPGSQPPEGTEFQYAVLRVVPRVERGEQINAGVVLFARRLGFLEVRVRLDPERLRALAPDVDPSPLARQLDAIARVAAGDPGAGPIARLPPSERFSWIVAPSSTAIQPSAVHMGLCGAPDETLDRLFREMVA